MAQARLAARTEHRARLREHDYPLKVHVGGPMLDPDGAMCGTMLIVQAETRQVVAEYLKNDPYALAGVYASVDIHAYNWGLGPPSETSNG